MSVRAYPDLSDEKMAPLRSKYKQPARETTARFLANTQAFKDRCQEKGVEPTGRQYRKMLAKRG